MALKQFHVTTTPCCKGHSEFKVIQVVIYWQGIMYWEGAHLLVLIKINWYKILKSCCFVKYIFICIVPETSAKHIPMYQQCIKRQRKKTKNILCFDFYYSNTATGIFLSCGKTFWYFCSSCVADLYLVVINIAASQFSEIFFQVFFPSRFHEAVIVRCSFDYKNFDAVEIIQQYLKHFRVTITFM